MGQLVLGRYNNVMNITQKMVKDFHTRNYVGKNIIISAAGNVDHSELKKLI